LKQARAKVIGGLEDEDVQQHRPAFPTDRKPFVRPQIPEKLQRDTSRSNEV
jgi:hypothetical protein